MSSIAELNMYYNFLMFIHWLMDIYYVKELFDISLDLKVVLVSLPCKYDLLVCRGILKVHM